jgi:hypothetical protein
MFLGQNNGPNTSKMPKIAKLDKPNIAREGVLLLLVRLLARKSCYGRKEDLGELSSKKELHPPLKSYKLGNRI